ncbi:hypothetical protein [Mycolicibacterium phlei]|jgi:hypothetical protein
MDLHTELERLDAHPDASRVFGQPYQTPDGTTIIPVAKVGVRSRRGAGGQEVVRPAGVFVVKDGKAQWRSAVDDTRIALLGITVGLVSATLAGIAMVKRPPWPDVRGTFSR